jgi:ABC-type sugar transport system substrate-binding protein
MNAAKATEIRLAILTRFPETTVTVTPNDDGALIMVNANDGQGDRRFVVGDGDLGSPIVRLLVGAAIS